MAKTLYQKLLEAGQEVSNHESDLYVVATPDSRELINESKLSFSSFRSQVDGRPHYEVPFAYDPFWAHKKPSRTLTAFEKAFLNCALWSSNDEDGEPLDANNTLNDFSEEALAKLLSWANAWKLENQDLVTASGLSEDQLGHSLWLSANGHGAGFFDWSGPVFDDLQDKARGNEFTLYVSDSETVEVM